MVKASKILLFVCILFLSGCAQKRPFLYPNAYLKQVGNERAQADIDRCMRLAAEYGTKSDSGEKVAKGTAAGAAVGGAAGAAGALTRGIIHSEQPDPVFRRFVEKCLREKGYEPIGWEVALKVHNEPLFEAAKRLIEGEYTHTISEGDATFSGIGGEWHIETYAIYGVFRTRGTLFFKGKIGYLHEDVSGTEV
jgi:hypothetical protein